MNRKLLNSLASKRLSGSAARRRQAAAGFTIIETLIVLAIAGIILLIVFEALPALARSSRNNQRRQDVQTILQAVSHYELDDSGNFPLACGGSTGHSCNSSVGNGSNDYFLQYEYQKLTYYDPANIQLVNSNLYTANGYTVASIANARNIDSVLIENHAKCDSKSDGSATNQGASYSDVVALYTIETGPSSKAAQCEQL